MIYDYMLLGILGWIAGVVIGLLWTDSRIRRKEKKRRLDKQWPRWMD